MNNKMTHKELLIFSNLTNLEWEFVKLNPIKKENRDTEYIYPKLNKLLNPKVFVKRNKEGEIEEYSYMEDAKSEEEITKDDLEEGLANMRHKAGVAMEYKEKSEGDFLSDWEVIYGGDKYKIMKDYLDQRWTPIYKLIKESLEAEQIKDKDQAKEFLNQDLYPSREKIEEKHSVKLELQVMTKKLGINVAGDILDASFPGKPVKLLKEVGKKVKNRLQKRAKQEALKQLKDINVNLYLALKLIDNPGDIGNLNNVSKEYKKLVENNHKFKELDSLLNQEGITGINFSEEIDMYDEERYKEGVDTQEFRVLVLKKEVNGQNQIVIAYNGKKVESKNNLPAEFEGLQLVYSKIAAQYPEAKITFTGCQGGADLALVNTLISEQRRCYQVKKGDNLSKIGKELIGSDWEGKLEDENKEDYTRNDHLIHPGDKIYYSPLAAGDISSTLFYENVSDMRELLNFRSYNLDDNYKSWAKFAVEGIGGELKSVALTSISLFIASCIGKIIHNYVVTNEGLLRRLFWAQNIFRCLASTPFISQSILVTMLRSLSTYLVSAGSALTTIIIGGLIAGGVMLLWLFVNKLWSDSQLQDFYDLLAELALLKKEKTKKGIEGYITDRLLEDKGVELTVYKDIKGFKRAIKVKIESEYGIYIKKEDLDLSLDTSGEETSLFVKLIRMPIDFLRFTKEQGIYKLAGLIRTNNNQQEFPKTTELIDAKEKAQKNFDDYLSKLYNQKTRVERIEYYEAKKVSFLELREEINNLKANNNLTTEEENLRMYLRLKEEDFLTLDKEIKEYQLLINTMKLFGSMQRVYEQGEKIFNVIYPTKEGMKNVNDFSAVDKQQEEIPDLGLVTESIFMTYIQENNQIGEDLRTEYKASLVKSMFQKYKEGKNYHYYKSMSSGSGPGSTVKNQTEKSPVKYGVENYKTEYWQDFNTEITDIKGQQEEINQEVCDLLAKVQVKECKPDPYQGVYRGVTETIFFNHYESLLAEIKDNPKSLEDYYHLKEVSDYQVEEVLQHPEEEQATHVIDLNPNYKDNLEYKYNPADEIMGGELKVYLKIEEEEIEEGTTSETVVTETKEESKEEEKESKKIEKEATPNSDFKRKKRLITNLTKTSSISEINKAAQVVVSELKRKRQPLIAVTLEDYLAGKRIQKRVDPKDLRTLKSVKAAETELRLKVNRRLVTKLSYILRNQDQIKRDERIKFRIRVRDLVRPYNKSIEEFINASKDSRLKVEGKFELKKIPNRQKLKLKGELCYNWENDYRWRVGKRKLLPGYGFIEDYQFKKLANKQARPYKMYAQWSYYLSTKLNLLHSEVDTLRTWCWREFCSFEHV